MSKAKELIQKEIDRQNRAIEGRSEHILELEELLADRATKKEHKPELTNAIKNAKTEASESVKAIKELEKDLKKL